jgi:acyl carrier protein
MKTCSNEDIVRLLIESAALEEGDEVIVDAPLKQMGVQSLDKFNVFLLIEDRYGIQVPDDEFDQLDTIEAIATYVSGKE